MPSFRERIDTTRAFISTFSFHFWEYPQIKSRFLHVQFGYESFVSDDVRSELRTVHDDETVLFVRFLPDFIVFDRQSRKGMLLEYKVSRTPRYSEGDNQWYIAQVESTAYYNYLNLYEKLNLKIAICLFVPYCKIPIFFDWIQNYEKALYRPPTVPQRSLGSGTPYVNVDVRKLKLLWSFLIEDLKIEKEILKKCFTDNFWKTLKNDPLLQTKHHPKSPYKDYKVEWITEMQF